MIPIVTLVGRPNVGKSTLFNRLTSTREALVGFDKFPSGLTRDRKYGFCLQKSKKFFIVDTGGINRGAFVSKGITACIAHQVMISILESDLILFVVDGILGLMPCDNDIIQYLRTFKKSIFIVINKSEHVDSKYVQSEFYSFGIKPMFSVSALHNCGVHVLLESIFLFFENKQLFSNNLILSDKQKKLEMFLKKPVLYKKNQESDSILLSVVGRPNVGKSTFINYILSDNRLVVYDSPGTTSDSVYISTVYNDQKYILIDTCGIQKKNKLYSVVQKISLFKTLQSIKNSCVVLFLIDASHGISDDDLCLLKNILKKGKSVVVGVNKWDLLSTNSQKMFKRMCSIRMSFIRFIHVHFISSIYGTGIDSLFKSINLAYSLSFMVVSTSRLTRIIRMASLQYAPPRVFGNKLVKFKYAHLGGRAPLVIVVHGSHVYGLTDNYKRYLTNYFCRSLNIFGASLRICFKESS